MRSPTRASAARASAARANAASALAVLLVLAACGDETTGPADDTTDVATDSGVDTGTDAGTDTTDDATDDVALQPLSTQQWCIQSNTMWCDWMYACLSESELVTAEASLNVTEESCASRLTADCQQRTMESVAAGRQSFDGEAAAICVAALEEEPCGTWLDLVAGDALNPDECHGITDGLVAPGDDCSNTLDCAAEYAWCWKESQEDTGYCTDSLGAGAFQSECTAETGTECAGRVCTLLPDNGSDWAGICSAECRTDRNCGPGAGCFQSEDDARFCLALCDGPDDCADGLECVDIGGRSACFVSPA